MGKRVREKMNNEREKNKFLKLLGKFWMRREQFRGEGHVGNLPWHSLVILWVRIPQDGSGDRGSMGKKCDGEFYMST